MRTTTQLKLSKLELLLPVNGKSKPENTEIDAYVDEQEHPVIHEKLINDFFPILKNHLKLI